jgi:arginine utilization protein RocB
MSVGTANDDFNRLYDDYFGKEFRLAIQTRYVSLRETLENQKKKEVETLTAALNLQISRLEEVRFINPNVNLTLQEYQQKQRELKKLEEEIKNKEKALQKGMWFNFTTTYFSEIQDMKQLHKIQDSQIKLDVGGVHYTTSVTTLTSVPDSMLAAMFSGRHTLHKNEEGRIFIDRNGKLFEYILDYLRDGEWIVTADPELLARLHREMEYYGLSVPEETTASPTTQPTTGLQRKNRC